MRKLVYIIILAITGVIAWNFYTEFKKNPDINLPELSHAPIIKDIKQEIFTPGALRKTTSGAGYSWLTQSGTILQTNQQRLAQNLPALKENSELNKAAQAKLNDMFKGQYFEHISPNGTGPSDLAKTAGYEFIAVGENLALGNYKNDKELVEAWMNSPGHRANILGSKFMEIGVAVGKGVFEGQETWLAVQEFGKPASSCPVVDLNLKFQLTSQKTELDSLEAQIGATKAVLESAKDPQTQTEVDEYNLKVSEYNALIRMYNNKLDILKAVTEQYNSQVQAYNSCLN